MDGKLFIVSSPSGGGKGTLIQHALRRLPGLAFSVSYTTRPIRPGEKNGREYNFVSHKEFNELIRADDFLEYAEVHGNLYGTVRTAVLDQTKNGDDVILEIDVQGAEQIRKKMGEAVSVFILPPSFEVLKERLESRETESSEQLNLRLENAKAEVRRYTEFEFVIINDVLEDAVSDLMSIISVNRLRRDRQSDSIRDILTTFDALIR